MSSTMPAQLAPTQFMPLPGGFVVLPPNARPDLAFEQTISFTPVDPVNEAWVYAYKVPQLYYVVPLIVQATLIVSVASGTQTAYLQMLDAANNTLAQIVSITTQPANTAYAYTWAANVSAAYATVPYVVLPLPVIVASPGYTLQLNTNGTGNNLNRWLPNEATMIFIPSGPAIANELGATQTPAAPVAVPLFT